MSQDVNQEFSHKMNTRCDSMEEPTEEDLTTITGGSASQDAKKGAVGGAVLGTGAGMILGAGAGAKHGVGGMIAGGIGGAVVGAGADAALGAAFAPLGGAILKHKHH